MASNKTITILALAARTTLQNTGPHRNAGHRGVRIHINTTVDPAAASITPTIQGYDPVSQEVYTLLAGAAIAAVGDIYLLVYPGATAAGNLVANLALPPYWRLSIAVADADSLTYGVTAELLI